MKNATSFLEIKNFKTIKHQRIACSRVNVFIGEPNVGKSNILEALALFSIPEIFYNHHENVFQDLVRFDSALDLFREKKTLKNIEVNCKNRNLIIQTDDEIFGIQLGTNEENIIDIDFKKNLEYKSASSKVSTNEAVKFFNHFKYYFYNSSNNPTNKNGRKLSIPTGNNLPAILNENDELFNFFAQIIQSRYDLKLTYDDETGQLIILRLEGHKVVKYSYKMIADTLRRLIFYYAAIESNKDSILIFEEPEVHSFPPYISMLGDKIARDKDNQYFITTHSPYMLNAIIENADAGECSVFVVDYKNHETIIKKLSLEQMQYIISNGLSSFFNLDKFLED